MEFADPEKNVSQFKLKEGQRIADLGAGQGAYSIVASKKVGPQGVVYAIEVQKDLVDKLHSELDRQGITNVEVKWGNIEAPEGTKLRVSAVDVVLLSNVLFQVEDMDGLAGEIRRILAPKGRLCIVDWADSFNNLGPDEDAVVSEDQARQFFENKGFVFEEAIQAGAHHYGFSMQKV